MPGTRSSRPIRAGRFSWRAKLCRICALHMLTQAMAKAFAPEVTVNCVAPGWIELDEPQDATAARIAARTPMKRNGAAHEVAEAVLFFAAGPRFVTGQILAVDGGLGLV